MRLCADEIARKRGARRRDPLARNAVVDDGETLQEERHGGRGRGQNAMCGIDPPGTDWQWRRRPAIGADQRDQLRGRDDIDDGIDRAYLVKCNQVRLDTMHFGFRLSQKFENRHRMLLHISIEAGTGKLGANVGPRPLAAAIPWA